MEPLTSGEAPELISNMEVMQLLSKRRDAGKTERKGKPKKWLRHRDWIEDKVFQYLETTSRPIADANKMSEMIDKLQSPPFRLTDAETLQIINFMPEETVDIHLMIEDLQSRMSEERQQQLLELIGSYLAKPDAETGEEAEKPTEGVDGDMENVEEYEAENDVAVEQNGLDRVVKAEPT